MDGFLESNDLKVLDKVVEVHGCFSRMSRSLTLMIEWKYWMEKLQGLSEQEIESGKIYSVIYTT